MEDLLLLFDLDSTSEVARHCKKLVVTSEDFANVILAGQIGELGTYRYASHFREISPPELVPTEEELRALGSAKVGEVPHVAQKALRKFSQVFVDRRLLCAHLFYTPNQQCWHLFFFDQRDYTARNNHWKHGPHIHYSRESLANRPLGDMWNGVRANIPVFPRALHIRYNYQHNRTRAAS